MPLQNPAWQAASAPRSSALRRRRGVAEKRLGSCAPVKAWPSPCSSSSPSGLFSDAGPVPEARPHHAGRQVLRPAAQGQNGGGAAGVHPGPRDCTWPCPQSLRRAAHPFLLNTGLIPRGFRPWQTQFPRLLSGPCRAGSFPRACSVCASLLPLLWLHLHPPRITAVPPQWQNQGPWGRWDAMERGETEPTAARNSLGAVMLPVFGQGGPV